MKRILLIAFFALGIMTINQSEVYAQADTTETHSVTVVIPTMMDLTASGATNSFEFANIADLTQGKTTSAITLNYSTNKKAKVLVSSTTANFGGTSATPMPANVLKVVDGTTEVALSTTVTELRGDIAKGTGSIPLSYKITPGLTYDPADYTLAILYTITVD